MKKIIYVTASLLISTLAFGQSHFSSQSHLEQVNQVCPVITSSYSEPSFYTASNDGFIIKWAGDEMGEHYQVSDVGIMLTASSPNGHDIAVYETDGGALNKVTVWDWNKLTKKYTKKLKDSVTSLSFSAKGNYLIIGTATIDGSIFVRTSDWSTVNKVRENTSIVNFIKTSDTEKTAVMYSPTGTLTYYNILNGKSTAKFTCVQGLSNVTMFCNNLFLAGQKDNYIYIIQATTGKTLSTIPCSSPIILSEGNEESLFYLEYDGKNLYELKMVEKISNSVVSNQRIVKGVRGPRGESVISCGKKNGNEIYLGSRNGSVYRMTASPNQEIENMTLITEDIYSKIYDSEPAEEDFFFLTKDSIYNSSYETGNVDKVISTSGETNFITYKNYFILYSSQTRNPVKIVDRQTNASEVLFTPKSTLQSVSIYGDKLVEIESSSTVNLYDLEERKLSEVFSGMGIQDAVLLNDGKVYIAKSASTSPASPLICVDPLTLETVPLKIPGQVTYGLSTNGKIIYGMNLQASDSGTVSYVFSYVPSTSTMTNILRFSEEDPEAFTYLSGDYLYTNIGKNRVYSYNIPQKKRFAYERSASMPMKVCKNSKKVVILNRDGSISWANANGQQLLADWYLTKDGQWYEF